MRGLILGMLVCALFIGIAAVARADSVLVHTYESNSRIYAVDPDTGASSLIGYAGTGITDLAVDSSGDIYGISLGNFYTISGSTGVATSVGSLGSGGAVGLDFSSDGTLYTVNQAGHFSSINVTTGSATMLFSTSFSYVGDVAHQAGSIFYGTAQGSGGNHLVRIDATAQTATDVGLMAAGVVMPGLDFDSAGRLLAYGLNGVVYEISNYTTSAAGTPLSNTGIQMSGATNVDPVPEPATLALFSLGAGALALRRRRKRKLA